MMKPQTRLFHLPLKGGGRRPQAAEWGSISDTKRGRDPLPNPPPFRGREHTERASNPGVVE
jgi:ATP-dependent Lhr-like helicase